jgi:hypothetical protein
MGWVLDVFGAVKAVCGKPVDKTNIEPGYSVAGL